MQLANQDSTSSSALWHDSTQLDSSFQDEMTLTETSSGELQTILNALPLMFFQKDTQNRILRTNQVVADLLDVSVDEIIGTHADQWFPDEADDFYKDDLKVIRSGTPRLSIIEQFQTQGSGKQWVSTDKHPHYNATGEIDGVLVFARRVDGKTLAEEQRSELEAQVRYAQKLDSIGVLAAGVAHDFNNYLTIIIAGTEMALDRLGRGDPEALPLEEALKAAHEAARIANQLVTYAGKSLIVSRPVNMSTLIARFSDMLYASVAKNVDLSFKLDFDIADINADTAQLHQLLINIVINASEAIDETHGKICISTSERHVSARELMNTAIGASLQAGRYVVITVKDSGRGMPADVLKHVFEPFFSTKKSGRGLGLATVIGTVKGHGGTLCVDSSEERGTTIEMLFPTLAGEDLPPGHDHDNDTAQDQAPALPDTTAKGPAHDSAKTGLPAVSRPTGLHAQTDSRLHDILIVDDNQAVRDVLQIFLESDGYQVMSAASGEEAMLMLQAPSSRIGAAIVDYCMPETNGLELFVEIRKLRPDIPFILVSGSANLVSTTQFESLPQVAFLKKPFDRASILKELRTLLESGRAEQSD